MNHHRTLLLAFGVYKVEVETLRKVIVYLNGTQLPSTSDGILNHKVELRAIERSLAIFDDCLQSLLLRSLYDSAFCLLPVFVASYIFSLVIRVAK